MKSPALRAVIAVIMAEIAPVLLLVALVAGLGGHTGETPAALANRLGQWVGPIGGALATLVAAWWAAQAVSKPIRFGAGIGLAVAAIDAGIILAGGIAYEWLFAASWAGRIGAGVAGGTLVNRGRA